MAAPVQWPEGLLVPNGGIDETLSPQKIPDHKWTSGFDVEPLPDGVRSRQGSSRSNATPLQAINISHEAGTASREFADGTSELISQGFTVGGSNIFVRRIGVRLKLSSGATASLNNGSVLCSIGTNTGGPPGVPTTVILGADVGNFSTYDPKDATDGVTSEYKWVHFELTPFTGTVTSAGAVLTDSAAPFTASELIGATIENTTDNSTSTCTANDTTTVTGVLSGGTKNTWTVGDAYIVLPREELTAATAYHVIITYLNAQGTGTNNISVEESSVNGITGQASIFSPGGSWTGQGEAVDLNVRIYAAEPTITGIIDYRKSDAATTRHLIVADGEVYKNVAGTMSAVSKRERVGLTAGDDKLVDWAIGDDRLFVTNDTEIPKAFYVDSSGADQWQNMGIAPPTDTISVTHPVAGGTPLTNADGAVTYSVDWYFYNSVTNKKSDTRYLGVDTITVTPAAGDELSITGFPSAPARENDSVDKIRIEVKESPSSIYRLAKEIAIGASEPIVIDGDDEPFTTEAEYVHAVPPVFKAITVAENRTFGLNTANGAWQLIWSTLVGTTPYYESFPAANVRQFGRGDGDYGTALFFMPPRTLIAGFKNSLYALDARRPGTSDILKIASGIGVAGPRAGLVVGNRFYFVSDGHETRGMFYWESGQPSVTLLAGVDDTFKGLNQTRIKHASCGHLAPGDNRFQWWTLLSTAANSGDRILVYDYGLDAWTVYKKDSTRLGSVIGEIESSSATALYLGGRNGTEYLQDAGSTDAGKPYFGRMKMKAMDFGAPFNIKRLRWVDYLVALQTSGAINMITERDYGQRSALSSSLQQVLGGAAFTLDTSSYGGTDTMGAAGDAQLRVAHRGRGKVFRPEFSSLSAWHLKGLSFGLQTTGKR